MKQSKIPLIIAFVLTAVSGVFCHVINDGSPTDHHVWVKFQVLHIIISVLFVVLTFRHIKLFKKWFSRWDKKALQHKSKNTIFVSLVLLLLVISGLALLFIEGGDSAVGLWHYRLGVLFMALCGFHSIRRLRKKFMTKRRFQLTLR
ncbi:MAG: hypothetical protein LIO90_01290 [Bacteroidales bacterium]|nr:hypothetical protein [Bacteroidales bacterium]